MISLQLHSRPFPEPEIQSRSPDSQPSVRQGNNSLEVNFNTSGACRVCLADFVTGQSYNSDGQTSEQEVELMVEN